MAFYDWNHDGKKDWKDNYIEYNIYKSSTGQSSSGGSSSGGNGSTFGAIIITIVLFFIIGGIINLFTPKCIVDGCNSEREEGSSYCYYHKNSAVYKYNKSHSNSSSYYSSTSSYSSSSEKKSSLYTSDKDDDPYDVSSYSDAEDFYYDNCDNFWDYEEAEEYYDEYGEK